MNITILIGIAILIIIILLSLKIIKGAIKFAFSILGVLFVLALVLGALAYMDAKQAQSLLEEGNKTLIYTQGENNLAGVIITDGGMLIEGEGSLPNSIIALNDETLKEYSPDNEVEELIIFITNNSFNNLEYISISEYNISKENFDVILQSNEPKQTIIEIILASQNITEEITTEEITDNLGTFNNEEFKAALFLMAFSQQAELEGTTFLLQNLKEENIIIRPEFMTLKLMNWFPDKLFTKALDKSFNLVNKEEEV